MNDRQHQRYESAKSAAHITLQGLSKARTVQEKEAALRKHIKARQLLKKLSNNKPGKRKP